MVKRLLLILLMGFWGWWVQVVPAQAQETVTLHLFWSKSCPHCEREREFLAVLEEEYNDLTIVEYEISTNRENALLLQRVGKVLKADVGGVPFTVIGRNFLAGFGEAETTGEVFRAWIEAGMVSPSEDVVGKLKALAEVTEPPEPVEPQQETISQIPEYITVPLIGQVELASLSLPALTVVIGALDGFNPCAMWVLLFLISLLIGMQDKRRMWLLGTTFIVASAGVYFLFMAAWLNFFLLVGYVGWIRLMIGLFALGVGAYQIRSFLMDRSGACKVVDSSKRARIFAWAKEILKQRQLLLAMGGMVLLAGAVNAIELVCSAGLPAIYTSVLAMSELAGWQYYALLILYVLVFMLDDLVVFFIAMTTLKVTGIEGKYARFSKLIGGMLVSVLGILLIFKPEWLMWG